MSTKETFSNRLSFIFSALGCAVGCGNIWRFPYLVGKYGGGIFLLMYLIIIFVIACPLLTIDVYKRQIYGRAQPPFADISRRLPDDLCPDHYGTASILGLIEIDESKCGFPVDINRHIFEDYRPLDEYCLLYTSRIAFGG